MNRRPDLQRNRRDLPVDARRPFPKGSVGQSRRPAAGRAQTAPRCSLSKCSPTRPRTLTRKAVELALGGDRWALRLCLERVVAPRREQPVQLPLPDLRDAVSLADAMAVISAAVSDGGITPLEASELGKLGRYLPPGGRNRRFRAALE